MRHFTWLLLLLMASLAARAEVVPPSDRGQTPAVEGRMRVEIVSGVGSLCPEGCPRWIAMEGHLTQANVADVVTAIGSLSPDPIVAVVNSQGGDVTAALEIGRILRTFDAMVIVGHTIFPPCGRRPCALSDTDNVASQRPVGVCHSACVYVLAGGTRRLAGDWARIAVHRPVEVRRTIVEATPPEPNAPVASPKSHRIRVERSPIASESPLVMEIRRYVTVMGVDDLIVDLALETPPSRLRPLTWSELVATRLLSTAPLP